MAKRNDFSDFFEIDASYEALAWAQAYAHAERLEQNGVFIKKIHLVQQYASREKTLPNSWKNFYLFQLERG